NIESNGNARAVIEVFDLQGRNLFTRQTQLQSGANTLSLNTTGMKRGIYIIRANINGTMSEQLFVVGR
ncbi:MAG: T9SS type A sorting domain-containing protein, partial [Bacteroidales bacterium]|nr:T9SS type A sorting domain-containing protein [Bacteroidales bacterium]